MPLHLLGKKSWNVYNSDNIAKVKRDEAAAAEIEAAAEERMQELDAERRIQILRGEIPTPLPIEDSPSQSDLSKQVVKRIRDAENPTGSGERESKRRKRYGENDTEFEMRIAKGRREAAEKNMERGLVLRRDGSAGDEAPLVDERGNIDLFPSLKQIPAKSREVERNEEVEREKERKKREVEEQFVMKFRDAKGYGKEGERPWYEKVEDKEEGSAGEMGVPGKDVWGNEDPRRKERAKARIEKDDPLAMMKMGARQVREVEKERKRWREEREREMRALEEERRRLKKLKKRREADDNDNDNDSLDGFRLDKSPRRESEKERERRHRHRHSRRRDEERREHKHRHRSRHHD